MKKAYFNLAYYFHIFSLLSLTNLAFSPKSSPSNIAWCAHYATPNNDIRTTVRVPGKFFGKL
jgi:hypothetical protein